jgi:SAM-dependent methyltransferase
MNETTTENQLPNRTLDLRDLERSCYRRILEKMDELIEKESISYLHPSKRWEYPWALECAALQAKSRILDAGCGSSIFPIFMATEGYRVAACDLSLPANLDRLHGVNVDYVQGNLTALPFADGSFDAVFCISVIEHLSEHAMHWGLAELRRVLRRGCKLLLTTDFYEDSSAEVWYEGPGASFRVDWNLFDEAHFRRIVMNASGFRVDGEVDLRVDWETVRPEMRRFHGYPYTSVGITLKKIF